eukprot:s886_g1.t2
MAKLERQERILHSLLRQDRQDRQDNGSTMRSVNSQGSDRKKISDGFRNFRSLQTAEKIQSIRLLSAERDQEEKQKDQASEANSDPEKVSNQVSNNSSIRLFKSYSAHDIDLQAEAKSVHRKVSSKKQIEQRESVVGRSSRHIQVVVEHPGFDLFFAVIVFLNAIFMGIEVQSSIDGDWLPPRLPQVVNYVFAALFTLELVVRFFFSSGSFFCSEDYFWNLREI